MGHDASIYHQGESPLFSVFFAVPFGMTADEQAAWIYHGGGQALWDEFNARFGIVAFPAGRTATQSFGWFKREINSMADFRSLKMRIPGLGGELVPGIAGEYDALPALQRAGVPQRAHAEYLLADLRLIAIGADTGCKLAAMLKG